MLYYSSLLLAPISHGSPKSKGDGQYEGKHRTLSGSSNFSNFDDAASLTEDDSGFLGERRRTGGYVSVHLANDQPTL